MTHRRNRLGVAAIALVVGSTVATAMLAVYYDAGRKMSRELRAYGANIMIGPARGDSFDQSAMDPLARGAWPAEIVAAAPMLYIVAGARKDPHTSALDSAPKQRQAPSGLDGPDAPASPRAVVVLGTWLDQARKASPWWRVGGDWIDSRDDLGDCLVGSHLAGQIAVNQNDRIELIYTELPPRRSGEQADEAAAATPAGPGTSLRDLAERRSFRVAGILNTGGPEDDQVIVSLRAAQSLSGLQGRVSAVALSATGSADRIENLAGSIASRLPGVRADLVRQIAESEGRILSRLRLTMLLVALLILTAASLSVGTTLVALVMDRQKEIGTMKAIGAEGSDLLRLFLVELAGLGLVSGIVGYILGMLAAQPIGRSLFNAPVAPRLTVFGIILIVSIGIAMLSGILPIKRIQEVEPALILKGD